MIYFHIENIQKQKFTKTQLNLLNFPFLLVPTVRWVLRKSIDKKLSVKVDCYSYGIVLFELASGLRAHDDRRQHKFLVGFSDTEQFNKIISVFLSFQHVGFRKWFLNQFPKKNKMNQIKDIEIPIVSCCFFLHVALGLIECFLLTFCAISL